MTKIPLNAGNGGKEMNDFLSSFLSKFYRGGEWGDFDNDSATFLMPDGKFLCFTTDSFVVDPIEFPGGNIGDLAFAGTINDLVVMGSDPIGLSCGLIIEEGFEGDKLDNVLKTLSKLSHKYQIPIVTGDTKVMEKGAIDGIVINTSGVGIAEKILNIPPEKGDKIIISGGIGEHGVALLSERFDFETDIVSDTKPLVQEMRLIKSWVKFAKDPTRGGISSALNEMAKKYRCDMVIYDERVPVKKSVKSAGGLLGIDVLSLANEGKIVCIASEKNAEKVVKKLKLFNPDASVIGEVAKLETSGRVILKTSLGSRILPMPSGKIVPRIC